MSDTASHYNKQLLNDATAQEKLCAFLGVPIGTSLYTIAVIFVADPRQYHSLNT